MGPALEKKSAFLKVFNYPKQNVMASKIVNFTVWSVWFQLFVIVFVCTLTTEGHVICTKQIPEILCFVHNSCT